MANTCITTLYLKGEEALIESLYDSLDALAGCHSNYIDSKELFDYIGTPDNEIDDYRSAVVYYERKERFVDIESAWSEPKFLIKEIIRFFGVEVAMYAEEPGADYYVTNDDSFEHRGRYIMSINCEEEYYRNEEEVVKIINDYIDEDNLDLDKITSVSEVINNNKFREKDIIVNEYAIAKI